MHVGAITKFREGQKKDFAIILNISHPSFRELRVERTYFALPILSSQQNLVMMTRLPSELNRTQASPVLGEPYATLPPF